MFSGRDATPTAVYHSSGRQCYYSACNVASQVAHLAILLATMIWNAVPIKLIQIHTYYSVSCTPPDYYLQCPELLLLKNSLSALASPRILNRLKFVATVAHKVYDR